MLLQTEQFALYSLIQLKQILGAPHLPYCMLFNVNHRPGGALCTVILIYKCIGESIHQDLDSRNWSSTFSNKCPVNVAVGKGKMGTRSSPQWIPYCFLLNVSIFGHIQMISQRKIGVRDHKILLNMLCYHSRPGCPLTVSLLSGLASVKESHHQAPRELSQQNCASHQNPSSFPKIYPASHTYQRSYLSQSSRRRYFG